MLKNFSQCTIVLACLTLSACSGETPPSLTSISTKDGHNFTFVERSEAQKVSISIGWPSNAMFSPELNPVLPHVATQLLVAGGTKSIAPADVLAQFQDLNSNATLHSQPGYIRGAISTTPEKLSETVALSNKVLLEPAFDQKWLTRTKRNLVARVEEMAPRADVKSWIIARSALFGGQSIEDYWSTPIERIEAITSAQVEQWHGTHFGTDNAIIAVSAAKYTDEIADAIDKLLDGLPSSTPQIEPASLNFNLPAKTIVFVDPDATNAQVLILGEIPNSKAGKDIEALMALNVLGQSPSSRLINVVREEQRATYSFSSGMIDFVRDHRLMMLTGAVDTKDLEVTLEKIADAYENFRNNGLNETEFTGIQQRFVEGMAKNIQIPAVVSNAIVEAKIDGLEMNTVLNLPELTSSITLEQQNDYVRSGFPQYSSMLKVLVLPSRDSIEADCVIESLAELENCSL